MKNMDRLATGMYAPPFVFLPILRAHTQPHMRTEMLCIRACVRTVTRAQGCG